MTTSVWNNDLARAYEEKYTILEEARIEYDREVQELLKAISAAVQAPPLDPAIERVAREPQFAVGEPGSSGRMTLEYRIPVAGATDSLLVSAWFSSPWRGVPGYLYLGVLAPDAKPWQAADLRNFVQHQACAPACMNQINAELLSEPENIYIEQIKLASVDLVQRTAESLRRFLLLARAAASHLHTEHDLELKMEELLVLTKEWLGKLPDLKPFSEMQTEIDDWEGQRYVQLSPGNGKPGFWTGYHAERGTLMFGYNRSQNNDFEIKVRDALRERAECSSFEVYMDYPGGTLFERKALRLASKNEILQRMCNAFEAFMGVLAGEK